jgi:hypothetical protein
LRAVSLPAAQLREPVSTRSEPGQGIPLCTYHDCRASGCKRTRDLDGGRSYCEAHDICGKVGCKGIKHPTKRFYEEHWDTCSQLDCFTRRKYHLITHSGWHSPAWRRSDRYYSYTEEADAAEYCPNHAYEGCFAARERARLLRGTRRLCQEGLFGSCEQGRVSLLRTRRQMSCGRLLQLEDWR